MTGNGYPYERQIEYWTSRAIEDYYLDLGYEVTVYPNAQLHEKLVPFDHLFDATPFVKVFGLQYKRLYGGPVDHWRLVPHQHEQLQQFKDWIYYCGSEVIEANEHRNALHLCKILPVTFNYVSQLPRDARVNSTSIFYYRWGGFAQALEGCRTGTKVHSPADLEELIPSPSILRQTLIDFIFVNSDSRRVAHVSPLLTNLGGQSEFEQ